MSRIAAGDLDDRAFIEAIPVRESFGFMIRLAYLGLRGVLHEELAAHRLSSGIWYYLWALWDEDGINQKELSERVRIKEASTTVTLRTMERHGLIRRVRSADDRRSMNIFLTEAGRKLESRLMPCANAGNLLALDGFSRAEVTQLNDYMRRVTENLRRHGSGATE